jgi:hypothetical protein
LQFDLNPPAHIRAGDASPSLAIEYAPRILRDRGATTATDLPATPTELRRIFLTGPLSLRSVLPTTFPTTPA